MNWIKPDWPVAANVHAAVTLRTGGASQGRYSSLNPAQHVNDDPSIVAENRRLMMQMLNLPAEPVWLDQVHGNRVVKADQVTRSEKADASYTDQPGTVCAVLTADCLPVLLASTDGKKVAVIHGGWRGLLSGVISQSIKALDTNKLIAWLGPAIGPDCFEVGREVRTKFVQKSTAYGDAFKQHGQDKFMADIYKLAAIELAIMGITDVYGGEYCTMTDKERFYSYRRDGETGRMATLIWRD